MTITQPSAAEWTVLAERLSSALHLAAAPIFLAFGDAPPAGVGEFDKPMSEPAADGRQGRVPASCVFWVEAAVAEQAFSTTADDHGNCSVGKWTHGFSELDTSKDDVAALLESGWVTPEMVPQIPFVTKRPVAISYGRLENVPPGVLPDVVLLRVNGRQMMVLSDSIPGLSIEGKPQCHIVALAKEHGRPAASVGCALSRARTGMRPDEMTCALPASQLGELVASIEKTSAVDSAVARYAAEDARRFSA
ncbi:MAG: DUF169 domain-containing protein [Acidimicrobiales bacterium]